MQDDGFNGNVKLDIIGVAVEVETMLTYVVTKEEKERMHRRGPSTMP